MQDAASHHPPTPPNTLKELPGRNCCNLFHPPQLPTSHHPATCLMLLFIHSQTRTLAPLSLCTTWALSHSPDHTPAVGTHIHPGNRLCNHFHPSPSTHLTDLQP
eukprot:1157298-Pelagomonas_calceolata.AAC.17